MYSYSTFALKSFCVRTQIAKITFFCMEYKSPYYPPYFCSRYTPPPSAGQTVVGCLREKFFLKIFFLFFKLAVNIQNHLYRILTLNIYARQNSKYLLVTLRKLLIIYSYYVLYGLFLSFAPRKE